MARLAAFMIAAALVAASAPADAQPRNDRRNRQEAARAQGVPPGHLPAANQCRVWYDDRPNGRQPAPTSCSRAESIAARDRNARVIYGEDAYRDARRYGSNDRYDGVYGDVYGDNDRAVRRGSVRDPRLSGGTIDRYGRDGGSPAFRNGYRDGLTKGREDAEDGDRHDVNRHSWYRSANRGYENEYGTRYEYIDRYRRGFEAGYEEGYRVYTRR
jgi:hypothetical protein